MATSRTGTAKWKALRKEALRVAQDRNQYSCPLCHRPLNYETGRLPDSAEVDHIIPHSRHGTDTIDNVRVICRHCNQSRGNRPQPSSRNTAVASTTTTLVSW